MYGPLLLLVEIVEGMFYYEDSYILDLELE